MTAEKLLSFYLNRLILLFKQLTKNLNVVEDDLLLDDENTALHKIKILLGKICEQIIVKKLISNLIEVLFIFMISSLKIR